MASKGIGIDTWEREALIVRGRKKGVVFQVTGCERPEVANGRLTAIAEPLGAAVAGLTGRDLILKYTRVPQVPDWQLQKLMDFEVQEIASQAGELSSDYNLLPIANEMTGEDTILLALAKDEGLRAVSGIVESGRGSVQAYTPNAIALYNAYLMAGPVTEDDIVLLAWIGESSLDLALVRGANLLFARNVSGSLQIIDGAISQAFNVREERARKIRGELLNLDPRARGSYGSSQEEKVAHSVQGVAAQLQAALRSTIAFCQSQTNIQDLALQRALVCGPGAKVKGLGAFLSEGIGCPVEVWDPVPDLDMSQCPPAQQQIALDAGPELVLALGLAMAPCFDDLYSIEILPAAVKRKRKFLGQTIFNIGAALLALAFLGWRVVDAKGKYEKLEADAKKASQHLKSIKRVDTSTKRVVDKNAEDKARYAALQELAIPLHATLRVRRALEETLPPDLWVTELRSERGTATWIKPPAKDPKSAGDRGAGSSKRPTKTARTYLVVRGKGVAIASSDLTTTFGLFREKLMQKVPVVEDSFNTVGGFSFQLKIDYLQAAEEGK